MNDRKVFIFDLEVFPNFFYALFIDYQSRESHSFTIDTLEELKTFLEQECILVGYNSRQYDDLILRQIIDDKVTTCDEIYKLSLLIVSGKARQDKELKKLLYTEHNWLDVDLMQIKPPSLTGKVTDWSLKKHQIRLRWKDVRDLPYEYDKTLTPEEVDNVIDYCLNDVLSTLELFDDYSSQGVINVANKIKNLYGFLGNKPFYTSQSSLGNEIVSTSYRNSVGLSKWEKIKKPSAMVFDPRSYLLENIKFNDKRNQEAFEYIKSIPPENVVNIIDRGGRPSNSGCTDWEKRHLKDVRFWAGNTPIRLGVGGIHTDFNQEAIEGIILDFDVTSYYPSLIELCGRSPAGLSEEWLKQYVKTFHKRVEYKNSGDTAAANVLKIVINSVYGQLNYPKSDFFDPAMLLMVTLNGQLLLIMLAELFAQAGYHIVSANTDGIMIKVETDEDKQKSHKVAEDWMSATSLNLEAQQYSFFVSRSINDYFAVKTNGDLKKKGFFNNTSGLSPAVISEGVIDYFINKSSISEFVHSKKSLFDFIKAGQAIKNSTVTWKDQTLQRNNRWYYSTEGHPIFHQRKDGNRNKLSGSDGCVPVNKIESENAPSGLNHDYYIEEIEKIINGIENQLPTINKDTSELIYNANKLSNQGLCILPKGRKDSPKANLPGTIPTEKPQTKLEDYPWYQYNGLGILSGKNFGVLAIDVDNLPLARRSGIFKHTQKSIGHMATWHGPQKRKEVVSGEAKGTILYQYDQSDLYTTKEAFNDTFGFEILYGKKVVQALGIHDNGEPYQYGGTIKPIPKKLLSFLKGCIGDAEVNDNTRKSSRDQTIDLSADLPKLDQFMEIANSDHDYSSLGQLYKNERNGRTRLEGPCPYGHHDSSGHEFAIDHNGKKFIGSCQHQKCKQTIRDWTTRIATKVDDSIRDIPEIIDIDFPSEQAKEISEVFQRDERFLLTIAPTGSGKSFNISKYLATRLHEESSAKKEDKTKFFILCSSKDEMKQCASQLCTHLDTKDLSQYGIDLVESEGNLKVLDTTSVPESRDSAIVVITHFTYASRKGMSIHHYSALKFVDNRTEIIIDEIDKFIEAQTLHVPFGWRGRYFNDSGDVKYQRLNDCLVSAGAGNCSQCRMKKYDGYEYRKDNQYGILRINPRDTIYDQDKYESNPRVEISNHISSKVDITPTTELTILKQTEKPREIVYDNTEETEGKNFQNFVDDLIKTSWKPTIWRHKIAYSDGTEVDTDNIRNDFIDDGKLNRKILDEQGILFPQKACNILNLVALDRLPMTLFSQCKRVFGLTATISQFKHKYLLDHLPDLTKVQVKPKDDQKMSKIILIGSSRKIPKDYIANFNKARVLRFFPKKGMARKEFQKLSKSGKKILYGVNTFNYTSSEGIINHKTTLHDVLITYSFGNLGRGVNLGDYPISVIDSTIYKPIGAYNTDSKEEIIRIVEDDRNHTIVQNVGRNWRPSNDASDDRVRINILERLNGEIELDNIAEQARLMSNEVLTVWIPTFVPDKLVAELLDSIVEQKHIPNNPPTTLEYYIEYFYKQGLAGKSMKAVKDSVNWKYRMSRLLTEPQKEELTTSYQKGVSERKDTQSDETVLKRKLKKWEKWSHKIKELNAKGFHYGQIKSRMNYSKFDEQDKDWFNTKGIEIFETDQ